MATVTVRDKGVNIASHLYLRLDVTTAILNIFYSYEFVSVTRGTRCPGGRESIPGYGVVCVGFGVTALGQPTSLMTAAAAATPRANNDGGYDTSDLLSCSRICKIWQIWLEI